MPEPTKWSAIATLPDKIALLNRPPWIVAGMGIVLVAAIALAAMAFKYKFNFNFAGWGLQLCPSDVACSDSTPARGPQPNHPKN
jgi:hypothetical protein